MNRYLQVLGPWLVHVLILSIRTAAQTLVGTMSVTTAGLAQIPWSADLSVAAAAGIACFLHNMNKMPDPTVAVAAPVLVPIEPDPVSSSPSDPTPVPVPAPVEAAPVDPAPTA